MSKRESSKSKKEDLIKKSRGKKVKDEEENEEEDEIIQINKSVKRSGSKKSLSKKKKDDSEDELSDLELNDEDDNSGHVKNEKNAMFQKIDSSTPIEKLNINEILSYLYFKGEDSFNPKLKFGALNLMKDLTGKKRRSGSKREGSKRDTYKSSDRRESNDHGSRGGYYPKNYYHNQQMVSGRSKRNHSYNPQHE